MLAGDEQREAAADFLLGGEHRERHAGGVEHQHVAAHHRLGLVGAGATGVVGDLGALGDLDLFREPGGEAFGGRLVVGVAGALDRPGHARLDAQRAEAAFHQFLAQRRPEPLREDPHGAVLPAGAAGGAFVDRLGEILEEPRVNRPRPDEPGLETVRRPQELAEEPDLLRRGDGRVAGDGLNGAVLQALAALGAGVDLDQLPGREFLAEGAFTRHAAPGAVRVRDFARPS